MVWPYFHISPSKCIVSYHRSFKIIVVYIIGDPFIIFILLDCGPQIISLLQIFLGKKSLPREIFKWFHNDFDQTF